MLGYVCTIGLVVRDMWTQMACVRRCNVFDFRAINIVEHYTQLNIL